MRRKASGEQESVAKKRARAITAHRQAVRHHLMSPVTDDELAGMTENAWTEQMRDNFARLTAIHPNRKTAVVVTMRDDGVSILEWVAHYRALGFDGIFVYSNDNRDDSDALLTKLAQHGIITFIENSTSGNVSPQHKAFAHSIHKLPELRDFEWVFYADSDEFLCFAPKYGNRIAAVLDDVRARFADHPPSAIFYHWKWFFSGGVYARTPGLLLTRFQHSDPHCVFKSIVRLKDITTMRLLHFPEVHNPGFFVDSDLQLLAETTSIDRVWELGLECPRYAGGHIRHYWTKSFQEFAIKKHRADALTLEDNAYRREFELFFDWNNNENQENFDPPDESLLAAVERELAHLREIPGVSETERHMQNNFEELLSPLGGDPALRELYQSMLTRRVEAQAELTHVGRRPPLTGANYLSCLAQFHDLLEPRTYLEIGTYQGDSLKLAHCSAIAVDPAFELGCTVPNKSMPALCLFQLSSDGFFKSYDPGAILGAPVDLAFLDGLHLFEYLLRDFINTERSCHQRSLIILHDCVPLDFPMTRRNPDGPERSLSAEPDWWTGDVWKMLPILARYRPDLKIEVFNAQPTGLVVIGSVDPDSRVLADRYDEIVKEFGNLPDESTSFEEFMAGLKIIDTSNLVARGPF